MFENDDKKPASTRRGFLQKLGLLSGAVLFSGEQTFAYSADVLQGKSDLRVMTCNIRVDLPEDEKTGNGWKTRKEACVKVIKNQKADIIGFQEVLANQFEDLKKGLSDYFALGFDGPEMDMYKEGYHGIAKNPIFFSKKRFELLTAGGYWLSETPLKAGSISWESARARNAFWVRLKDRKTGKQIRVVNLHLDHVKEEARVEQIKMVLDESAQYQPDFIQIMTGDFNAGPNSHVVKTVLSSGWKDSYTKVGPNGKVEGTTHAFKPHDKERAAKAKKIDYIFTRGPIESVDSHIIKDNYKGIYPSDHYFVVATFRL